MSPLKLSDGSEVINHFEQLQRFCEEQNLELRLCRALMWKDKFLHYCTVVRIRGDAKLEVQGKGDSFFEALKDAVSKMDAALSAR